MPKTNAIFFNLGDVILIENGIAWLTYFKTYYICLNRIHL